MPTHFYALDIWPNLEIIGQAERSVHYCCTAERPPSGVSASLSGFGAIKIQLTNALGGLPIWICALLCIDLCIGECIHIALSSALADRKMQNGLYMTL